MSYSNYSLRFPRTLREAFGPYTSADAQRDDRWDRLILRGTVIVLLVVPLLLAKGWL